MSAVQSNQIFILSGTANVPTAVSAVVTVASTPVQTENANGRGRRIKPSSHQSLCDLLVILITLPTLAILAIMLESTTRQNWLETTETRLLVLGLGAALAVICLALCMYVTSRLGKRFMWVGPQYTDDFQYSYYNPQASAAEASDLPPKYEEIVRAFDIPPPAYDTLIDIEKMQIDCEKCPKESTIQHI